MGKQYSEWRLKNAFFNLPCSFVARHRISMALAILSFAIYLFAAVLLYLKNQSVNGYGIERSSFAAAISNVAFDAPLGAVFSEVLTALLTFTTRIDTLIERVASGEAPNRLVSATNDGT